jgi:hypothetical protein
VIRSYRWAHGLGETTGASNTRDEKLHNVLSDRQLFFRFKQESRCTSE